MLKRFIGGMTVAMILIVAVFPALVSAQDDPQEVDLDAIKTFALDNATEMKTHTETLARYAGRYYTVLAENEFDYEAAWENHAPELSGLLAASKEEWILASTFYEVDEGIVAGVPSLSYYDTWLDAGPSGEDGGEDALDWTLELPNGDVLESPGNFFHSLTEPTLWGTNEDFVGLRVDLDGNGDVEAGEVLPEANIFLSAFEGMDAATGEMLEAIEAWEPTLDDTFTALVIMVPTMSEYFEQWKESAYVAGEESEEQSFVAVTRLFDIVGILTGLHFAYENVAPAIEEVDPELNAQIATSFDDLLIYVQDLYDQEQEGVQFLPEEADEFGTEAQNKAQNLAALFAEAAELLELELAIE